MVTKYVETMYARTHAEVDLEVSNHAVFPLLPYLNFFFFAAPVHITIDPADVTVALNQMQNVTFQCSLSDPSLRIHWIVKFPDITKNLSTRDNSDMPVLTQRGVTYDSSSVTIPGVLRNNGTLIRCATIIFTTGVTEFSDLGELIVAGKPT